MGDLAQAEVLWGMRVGGRQAVRNLCARGGQAAAEAPISLCTLPSSRHLGPSPKCPCPAPAHSFSCSFIRSFALPPQCVLPHAFVCWHAPSLSHPHQPRPSGSGCLLTLGLSPFGK